MKSINLRDFYYWYDHDELIEVADDVAAELLTEKRSQRARERQMYRYRANYSLDADNGIESSAIIHMTNDPDEILEMKEWHCRLCQALNSLPEIQGRRVEAHLILGMSQAEISKTEGVTKGAVSLSINKGLAAMKKYLKKQDLHTKLSTDICHSY